MYQWEIFIAGYFVELFECDCNTLEEGAVLAGKRARQLLKDRNLSAKTQYFVSDIELNYLGFKPKKVEHKIVSTQMPPRAEDWYGD